MLKITEQTERFADVTRFENPLTQTKTPETLAVRSIPFMFAVLWSLDTWMAHSSTEIALASTLHRTKQKTLVDRENGIVLNPK